ncbi:MAG TPA: DUF1697 domain-containing protein [Thermoanaerobaculia bacterium]|jgi:uncharacterized protein (DUF1697 family)
MPRHIAFLRAINVGGHVVKMDELRRLFERLGHSEVETFIASGNVIFASASRSAGTLERAIEAHLEKTLGYAVATFIRSPEQLSAIGGYRAFPDEPAGTSVHLGFLSGKPASAAIRALESLRTGTDDFRVRDREVYWRIHGGFSDSKLSGAKLERLLGVRATFRNRNTVTKLAAKYA